MAVQPADASSSATMATTSATEQSPAGATPIENTAKGARNLSTFFITCWTVSGGLGPVGQKRRAHVIDITALLKVFVVGDVVRAVRYHRGAGAVVRSSGLKYIRL